MDTLTRIAHMFEMLRAHIQDNRRLPPEFQMHVNALHDDASARREPAEEQEVAGEEHRPEVEMVGEAGAEQEHEVEAAPHQESEVEGERGAVEQEHTDDARPVLSRPGPEENQE